MNSRALLKLAIREIAAPMTGMLTGLTPNRVVWGGFALGPGAGEQVREEDPVKKRAACVLIRRGGQVLAVSRKDDPDAMGLPGGKVDDVDESIAAAASRELREETGLSVDPDILTQVFEHEEDDGYTTTTFEVEWRNVRGPIRTIEPGRVRWVSWDELLRGPFGRYNRDLMMTIGATSGVPIDTRRKRSTPVTGS